MSNENKGRPDQMEDKGPATSATEVDQKVDPDREPIDAFLNGNKEAFEHLVIKYQDRIFHLAYRFMNNREEAEELSQEIFVKVFRQLGKFRGEALFSTWLFQVATNHCKNRLKYLQRRKAALHDSINAPIRTEEGEVERSIPDDTRVPEDLVEREQIRRMVREKIAALPEDFRTVLIMRDIQGMSYEEIATALGTAEGTVKSRLHRARSELKERLKSVLPHGY
jgi:RNA polymerase sigma-70 factor, ECF subfamily